MNKNDKTYISYLLQENSLSSVGKIDTNDAFGLYVREMDEFAAVYVPHVQSIRGTKILTGVVGVARRVVSSHGKRKLSFLLSEHTFNFPELSYLHELARDREEDLKWCAKVTKILRELPTNRQAIEDMIGKRAVIQGVSILDMVHQDNS